VSTSASILQEETSIDEFFNVMATETLALFEHLEFDFLEEFDVFAPLAGANTRSSPTSTLPSVPALLLQERLRHPSSHARTPEHGRLAQLWLRSTAVERRGRSLPHRPRTRRRRVFDRLVEQAACRGLLDLTYSIDSTDVRTMPADQDASKGYDPTAEEYYHGYGCTIVSTGQKIPIAAEFTESKQAPEDGDARHV